MTTQNNNEVTITIGDKSITILKLQKVPFGIIRKTRNISDDEERLFAIIELLFSEGSDELDFIDNLKGDEVEDFMKQWTGGENITVGES